MPRRLRGMRIAIGLGALLVVAGCTSAAGSAGSTRGWVRDTAAGISVSHPPDWRVYHYDEVSSFSRALVFFSNRSVATPCMTRAASGGTSVACTGLPPAHLDPGAVVVGWFAQSFPSIGDPLAHLPGPVTTIDGHRAKVETNAADYSCKDEGGTDAITVTIENSAAGGDSLVRQACLSHPSAGLRGQVLASARSVQLGAARPR